ncbi:MAG: hypothetical protein KGJ35_03365 [Patescibacteria group bacterium]|nr:hypothetical protein [Patescibacteria group bacterium]
MGIETTYRKEQERLEKAEREKAGIKETPPDTLTIKKILDDKEQSALFGDLLKREGQEELAQRLVSGKIEADDLDKLAEYRREFSEKMRQAENIEKSLTPEMAAEIIRLDPNLQKIAESSGQEGIIAAAKESLRKMAISDQSRFDEILRHVENVNSYHDGDFKKLETEVEERCKKMGVNADKYYEAMAINDFDKRQEALSGLIKKDWGKTKRFFNMLFGRSFELSKRMKLEGEASKNKHDIEQALAELNKRKGELGSVMAASIKGNKEFMEAISRQMVGEPKKKEVIGMKDAKSGAPTVESTVEEWKRHKSKFKNWDQMDEAQIELERGYFLDDMAEKNRKNRAGKVGFWASIFGAIFDSFFTSFDKSKLN